MRPTPTPSIPRRRSPHSAFVAAAVAFALASFCHAQVAVRAKIIHTMAGPPVHDGIVVFENGKVAAVGPASEVKVPDGLPILEAAVVTPGLVDARATVGLTGILNSRHDSDQIERSSPIQPELRAIDAYNPQEHLVAWVRSFGVTTVHTGHAPGELISGQTAIFKTIGNSVEEAAIVPVAAIAATIGISALKGEGKSPGTRGKAVAMLREELIKARHYADRLARAAGEEPESPIERNLRSEILAKVLAREIPLLVHCNRAQDIASALRLAAEFNIRIILDSAAESYLLLDEIKAAEVPVFIHPLMQRAVGEAENQSFTTPARLRAAGIPFAIQSGYESYVPKVRVILLEAAIAAANGLSFDEALAAITIDAARILGVSHRIGSLAIGKDGDAALYDGDPFEYTTRCIGVVINGRLVSDEPR